MNPENPDNVLKALRDGMTPPNLDNIPPAMKALKNWILWKYELRKNSNGRLKPTKIPYQINGAKAKSTGSETWSTLEEVKKAYEKRKAQSPATAYDGIGFVFSESSEIMGIDWDHVKDPKTGEWDPDVIEEIKSLNSYAEISPSGTGAHCICVGEIPGDRRRKGNIEMYEAGRYFTVTGEHIPGTPDEIRPAQREINRLYEKRLKTEKNETTPKNPTRNSRSLSDSEILEIAGRARNAGDFNALYNGDFSRYDSQSEGDAALCGMIAFYTQDSGQIDRIFSGSGLYRAKWDRADYKDRTIKGALKRVTATYNPDKTKRANREEPPQKGRKQPRQDNPVGMEKDPFSVDVDELDQPEEVIRAAEEEARRILAEGDPIRYILETIRKKHTGDERTQEGIAVSIAGQSCLNTSGLQISVNGESGSGKSHGLKSHLHLVPRAYKRETSLSAKAAYYMDLEPGIILFSDDKDPSEDMEEVIKRAATNYQEYTEHTTVKDLKTQTVTIPPRINWYLTSVESNVSDQLLNRQLTFSTDSGSGQKKSIFEMQKAEAMAGELFMLEVTPEVLTCRRIYSDIKKGLYKVKIPFADRIDIRDKSNSRIFPMFLDMIKGYSIFKNQQRERDEEGYILADLEDFDRAKKLFESQRESLVSKLSERERTIIQYIAQNPGGVNINDISTGVKQPYKTVYNTLVGRKDRATGGLLEKFKGLTMAEENTSVSDGDGGRTGRKDTVFRVANVDRLALYDTEFIKLLPETGEK